MKKTLQLSGVLLIALCVILLAPPAAQAEEEEAKGGGEKSAEAVEILKKVDTAIKEIDAVSYHATFVPSGIATNFVAPAEGDAVMIGWVDSMQMPDRFYAHIKSKPQGSETEIELTGGGDGDTFFIVDHSTKKGYEDMDPSVMGRTHGRTLRNFGMMEFVHPSPFDDEMNAETVTYEGMETIDGVECHKIHVIYAGGQGQSTWHFGAKDMLPRKRTRHFNVPNQGEGAVEITVTELKIGPSIDSSIFKMQLPSGYEAIDDFAP